MPTMTKIPPRVVARFRPKPRAVRSLLTDGAPAAMGNYPKITDEVKMIKGPGAISEYLKSACLRGFLKAAAETLNMKRHSDGVWRHRRRLQISPLAAAVGLGAAGLGGAALLVHLRGKKRRLQQHAVTE